MTNWNTTETSSHKAVLTQLKKKKFLSKTWKCLKWNPCETQTKEVFQFWLFCPAPRADLTLDRKQSGQRGLRGSVCVREEPGESITCQAPDSNQVRLDSVAPASDAAAAAKEQHVEAIRSSRGRNTPLKTWHTPETKPDTKARWHLN